MGSRIRTAAVVVLATVALACVACSDDGDDTSAATTTRGTTDATVNPQYETWCDSVRNLIDQSSPSDLSDLGALASFTEAIQSLAATGPEPIQPQLQTLATASQAKLEASEQQAEEPQGQSVPQDPAATLSPERAAEADRAAEDVSTFVFENCGGLELPTIDL